MAKGTDPLSAQIARDHLSGLLCYNVSQGKTMSHTQASSRPPPTSEFPTSHMESPTLSQFSCDTSDTNSSPGAWPDQHIDQDHLPLQVKDAKLQVHFFRMEKTLRTCHPAAVYAEAVNLTKEIVAGPVDVASSIQTVAETLTRAGCRRVEYSRSCALIAHEIFCQLQSTSYDASISFRDSLIHAAMKLFEGYYLKVSAYDP